MCLFKDINGTNATIKHIPFDIPTLEDINAPDHARMLSNLSNGLFLVTGPASSGKSTTIASIVDHINKTKKKHIVTLEDPIEYRFKPKNSLIFQKQIPNDSKTLTSGLRSTLLQNPDILVITELTGKKAIELALDAANTGHLVLAAIRAKSITAALDRVLSFFEQSRVSMICEQLSSTLTVVIHQNLLRKKDGGLIAAYESLIIDQSVKQLITEGNHHLIESHIKAQKEQGSKLLADALIELVQNNIVSPDEAIRHVSNKANFIRDLQKNGYTYDVEDVS